MLKPADQPDQPEPPAGVSPGDDQAPGPPPVPRTTPPAVPRTTPPDHAITPTRAARLWVTLGFGVFFLLAVLIFIIQNGARAKVHFITLQGSLPLGIALLLAAVGGVLVAVLLGAVRITQLRRVASRHRRRDA